MWSWWDCMHWWSTAWNSNAWDGSMPWLMFLPMLWPVVMVGGLVGVVVLLVRSGRTKSWREDRGRPTPFEILRERFARGEINRQEYEDRKGLLSQP